MWEVSGVIVQPFSFFSFLLLLSTVVLFCGCHVNNFFELLPDAEIVCWVFRQVFFFRVVSIVVWWMYVSFRDSCKRRGEFFKSTRRQLPRTRDPSGCGVLLFPVSKSRADFKLYTEENCLKKIVKCVLSVLLLISFPFAPLVKG